jgi:cell shape-determining protein MreC
MIEKLILLVNSFMTGGLIMSLLIGGVISAIFGLISLIFFWSDFMTIIRGAFPIFLLLGGALAVYVGIDELQEKEREERQRQEEKLEKAQKEIELVKAQALLYKEELNKLKESKQ